MTASREHTPLLEREPLANAFHSHGGPDAVLLIHGFTGTPAEMRPVADRIFERFGWAVQGILLPGHGTTRKDLARRKRSEWVGAVRSAFEALSESHDRIHVAGLSMGALLALDLAASGPSGPASLALFSPSLFFRRRANRWLLPLSPPLAACFPRFSVPKASREPGHIGYSRYPLRAIPEFRAMVKRALAIPALDAVPAFVCMGGMDDVVHPDSLVFLKDRLRHTQSRFFVIEGASHILTIGEKRGEVLSLLCSFYESVTGR